MHMVLVHRCRASTSTRMPTTWSIANSNDADWVNSRVLATSGSTGNGLHSTRCIANIPALAAGLHATESRTCETLDIRQCLWYIDSVFKGMYHIINSPAGPYQKRH